MAKLPGLGVLLLATGTFSAALTTARVPAMACMPSAGGSVFGSQFSRLRLRGGSSRYDEVKVLLKEAFDAVDEDKSGTATLEEVKAFRTKLGLAWGADEEALFKVLDQDGSGSITFEEWITVILGTMLDSKTADDMSTKLEAMSSSEFDQLLADLDPKKLGM